MMGHGKKFRSQLELSSAIPRKEYTKMEPWAHDSSTKMTTKVKKSLQHKVKGEA